MEPKWLFLLGNGLCVRGQTQALLLGRGHQVRQPLDMIAISS